MWIPFRKNREPVPDPAPSGRRPQPPRQRPVLSGEDVRRELDLRDIIDELQETSFFGLGAQWQRGAVWRAQQMYENEGYTFEIVNEIADFAVGSGRVVDFGDEELNNHFYAWKWNPLSRVDTPVHLAKLLAVWLLRDGDDFLEKIAPRDLSRVRLLPIDARFIWSNAGGYSARESLGVKLNDLLEPVAYVYNPTSQTRFEIQPQGYREMPARTMIHAFRTEYAGQTRGFPWIRRALPWLRILEDFDSLTQRAVRRMVTNPGYWQYPIEYMLQDTDTEAFDTEDVDEAAAIRSAYKQILEETRWEDVDVEPRLPNDIEWKGKQHTGLQEHVVKEIRGLLLERIARSVGLSPLALSARSDGGGFLEARVATQGDQKFYESIQEHVRPPLTEVVEYWLDWAMNKSLLWQTRYQGRYRIAFPAFAYVDPFKDAAAVKTQLESNVLSPQQAIRNQGGDPERVATEILEWREKLGQSAPAGATDPVDTMVAANAMEQ